MGLRLAIVAMLCLPACVAVGSDTTMPAAHWTAEGFRNNYPHPPKQSFWRWKWEQVRDGVPKAPEGGWKLPHRRTDPAALAANRSKPTITWIGHASSSCNWGA